MLNTTTQKSITLPQHKIYEGSVILVNPHHPIQKPIRTNSLTDIVPGISLERKAASFYDMTIRHIQGAGEIVPVSGYRTKQEQVDILNETIEKEGKEYAYTYVALPDCSEHQTGLAIDVATKEKNIDFVAPSFPYHGISQQFREAAVLHGFIERYPAGKEYITQIGHEPWHFRYVGVPHSLLITGMQLTLEEYTDWVRQFLWNKTPYSFAANGQRYTIGFLPASSTHYTEIVTIHTSMYTISGNNVDGFVIATLGGHP